MTVDNHTAIPGNSMHRLLDKLTRLISQVPHASTPPDAGIDDLISRGHRLEDEKRIEDALECYRSAIAADPSRARGHINAGNALLGLERQEDAIACYREAIRLEPANAHAHFNLGKALQAAGRAGDAIAAYQASLRLAPELAEAHVAMGAVYEDQKNPDQAMAEYREAITVRPGFAEAHYNLALLYFERRELDNASDELNQALRHRPDYSAALEKLASVYIQRGFAREAVAQLGRARHLEPDNYAHHSHYLLDTNYLADIDDMEVFAEHLAYGEKFGSGFEPPAHFPNDLSPDRILRVGYVSGDFRQHPVLRFIELLLEKHHRDQIEVYCYSTLDKPDVVTERLKGLADQWRETLGLDDDAAAQLIRDDRIDILVDLSGHTGYQRLAVFARKPAPVQATWLGYLGTTGLPGMDYRICDAYSDPPGQTEKYHTEKLARMPDCQWCYRPPRDLPAPGPLPMLSNGCITFGSFNNIAKLNDQVLELWARLMMAIPDARLLIAAMPVSVLAEQRIAGIFQRCGVDPRRIDFRARQPAQAYYHTCMEADIALDPFPYNGGTTSIDILCLGVPIITLAGTRSIARGGVTLLSNLGLPRFIAGNEDEYVEIARHWAAHPDELAKLRAELPGRVMASPLLDEERFVSNMERLYREMWNAWRSGYEPHG